MADMQQQPPLGAPTPAPNAKKPIWKRWWLWAIIVVVGIIAIAASRGGGGPAAPASTTTTTAAAPTRDNSSAKLTTLGAGTFDVGADIPPGRYAVTPGAGQSGNLIVSAASGWPTVNEILEAPGVGLVMGVPSATIELVTGQTVQIMGMSAVTFTPAETVPFAGSLTAGGWQVGIDIPAGRYVATPGAKGSGNFLVSNANGLPAVNEILESPDAGLGIGVPSVTLTLKAGQTVTISGIASVNFATA